MQRALACLFLVVFISASAPGFGEDSGPEAFRKAILGRWNPPAGAPVIKLRVSVDRSGKVHEEVSCEIVKGNSVPGDCESAYSAVNSGVPYTMVTDGFGLFGW